MSGLPVFTRGLVHIYRAEGHDVAALSGVDLDIAAGELVGLLGPSGSGKSTLLTLLGGLLRPSAGKVHLGADELSAVTEARLDELRASTVSLMLQGAGRNLLPYLTVRENISFAQVAAARNGVVVPRIEEVLDRFGLGAVADQRPGALTPGHRQLAAVAVAIAPNPAVLLADEPTSQLDHEAADLVLGAIEQVNRDLGTTVVLVTHDPAVADRLPRTVTIRDGRIGGEGRSGEEYAVVTADGFLPLPAHALEDLPPGTLLRLHLVDGVYHLIPEGTQDGGTDE
ncbi:MAG: ABC transporter ATP-binding protein [Marmoricola sp.]